MEMSNSMKLYYVDLSLLNSSIANMVQILKVCEGYAEAGVNIELRCCQDEGKELDKQEVFENYGIQTPFEINALKISSQPKGNKLLRNFQTLSLGKKLLKGIDKNNAVIYTRNFVLASLAVKKKYKVIMEEHAFPVSKLQHYFRKKYYPGKSLLGTVYISEGLKKAYRDYGYINMLKNKSPFVYHDCAATHQIIENKELFTGEKPVIAYVGSLLPGRGLELIVEVATSLPQYEFKIIGEKKFSIEKLEDKIPNNINFTGYVYPGMLKEHYKSIDIVLMPYQKDTQTDGGVVTVKWMSPLKMFEYMSSGSPIVSSNLEVLREVLGNDKNALLCDAESVEEWVTSIQKLVNEPNRASSIAEQAQIDIKNVYNWKTRALKTLDFFNLTEVIK